MIIDARSITEGETVDCDICIVGAGAVGIALALEFCNHPAKVVLLESGGMTRDNALEQLNHGEVDLKVHSSLEANRRRYLGGATTVWGGRCVPFDVSDFEQRDYIPYSGWPIQRADLDPYYKRANTYCEAGDYTYTVQEAFAADANKTLIPGFESESVSIDQLYLFSPPTDFGKRYLQLLKQANNLNVFLHANCLKIVTDAEGQNVSGLQVSSLRKNPFFVRAKQYVLATGGLEATRLLLLSDDVHRNGIGNAHDLLGRFYMGHINSRIKVEFTPQTAIAWDYEKTPAGIYCQRSIAIREDQRRQYRLLNQRAFVERPKPRDPSHGSSVLSATYLAKSLINKQLKYQHFFEHLQNIAFDFNGLLGFSYKWLTQRILSERKLPSIIVKPRSNIYTFRIDSEQVPNPDSRVTLSDNKDIFGLNQLKVDWRRTELDIMSIEKSVQVLDQALNQAGVGKVQPFLEICPQPQGGHHLGTTRMADTPHKGVVDQTCKVYGLTNLYIASSSVFTTSSYANPTLTVVALAIRLADHIKCLYQ